MTEFRLQRSDIQAPLAAPTYLTHVTAPSFRRGRFFAIAIALHVIAIVAFLVFLHLKYPAPAPDQPTLSLVVTDVPYTGSGPQVITPTPAIKLPRPPHSMETVQHVPAPQSKPAPDAADAAEVSPDVAHTAKQAFLPLPAPAAPPPPQNAPSPAPSVPVAVQHLGDNQPQGSGLVMDAHVIPAVPDANVNQPPQYPRDALIHGEQGRVLLSINVMPNGKPSFIKIATGSGYAILDQAAEAAVMQWRFQPAQRGGKPVASVLPFWISFELN